MSSGSKACDSSSGENWVLHIPREGIRLINPGMPAPPAGGEGFPGDEKVDKV
jgi:hypothetical protein